MQCQPLGVDRQSRVLYWWAEDLILYHSCVLHVPSVSLITYLWKYDVQVVYSWQNQIFCRMYI